MRRGHKQLEDRFRGRGFKWTIPRQVILGVMTQEKKHLSVDQIYIKVHRQYPGIGLTTIYRTLEILYNLGLIRRYDFGDGKARYEMSYGLGVKHHHHLVCRKCGKIIDYEEMMEEESKLMKELEKKLSRKYNFKIDTHQIHFYGLCAKCNK
jgi:Fur family transcriptional regulator, ferric uptake regulator